MNCPQRPVTWAVSTAALACSWGAALGSCQLASPPSSLEVEVAHLRQRSRRPWALVWELAVIWEKKSRCSQSLEAITVLAHKPELIFEGGNQVQWVDLDCLKGAGFLLIDVADILLKLAKLVPWCSSSSKLMLLQFHYSTLQAATVS